MSTQGKQKVYNRTDNSALINHTNEPTWKMEQIGELNYLIGEREICNLRYSMGYCIGLLFVILTNILISLFNFPILKNTNFAKGHAIIW